MSRKEEATLTLKVKEQGSGVIQSLIGKLNLVDLAMSAIVATGKFLWSATEAFAEQEKAVNELTGALAGQGIYTTALKNKYIEMSDALQASTNVDNDHIVSSQAIMQSYLGQTEITERLMKATIALSLKKKIDLATASEMVGKTIAGETNMLKRQGIEFDNTARGGDRLIQVLTGIENKTRGAIGANMAGIEGASKSLNLAWGDLLKNMGSRTGPMLETAERALAKFLQMITPEAATSGVAKFNEMIAEMNNKIKATTEELNKSKDRGSIMGAIFGSPESLARELALQKMHLDDLISMRDKARSQEDEKVAAQNATQAQLDAEKRTLEVEKIAEQEYLKAEAALVAKQEASILLGEANDAEQLAKEEADVRHYDKLISQAKSFQEKNALLKQKEAEVDQVRELKTKAMKEKIQADTFATIATLAESHNSTMRGIGKAAVMAQKAMAITQIAIDTPVAISKTMAAFPAPFNFALAAAVGIAMAAQAASIAGVQLADGGIVMPRPGGIQATIGEGGQAEAVIPLDRAGEFGMGGGTTINFYGPVLGDESQARRFAEVVDRELYSMRKSNSSLSFEGII